MHHFPRYILFLCPNTFTYQTIFFLSQRLHIDFMKNCWVQGWTAGEKPHPLGTILFSFISKLASRPVQSISRKFCAFVCLSVSLFHFSINKDHPEKDGKSDVYDQTKIKILSFCCQGLFTYNVSQKRGGLPPPPSPRCQKLSAFPQHPFPPSSSNVSICPTPPPFSASVLSAYLITPSL